MLFTEFGYVDTVGAAYVPNSGEFSPRVFLDADQNGRDDGQETQANAYQALFNVMDRTPGVLTGAFLWGNMMGSNALWASTFAGVRDFSIRDKLSEDVVRATYGRWRQADERPLSLNLALNTHTVAPGDLVQVSVSEMNTSGARAVDLYFVIVPPSAIGPSLGCPNGDALAFVVNGGAGFAVACASAGPQTFPAMLQSMTIVPGLTTTPKFFDFTWPTGAPQGSYTFAIVATPPGAFADGSVDGGDLLTIGSDSLTTAP